ncbi:hypothetical protein [Myroides odoratus]|uniref:hypothetical protein n=1 Tax=Myroides odoratus TaxID=256 RepID=UPI0033401BD1
MDLDKRDLQEVNSYIEKVSEKYIEEIHNILQSKNMSAEVKNEEAYKILKKFIEVESINFRRFYFKTISIDESSLTKHNDNMEAIFQQYLKRIILNSR